MSDKKEYEGVINWTSFKDEKPLEDQSIIFLGKITPYEKEVVEIATTWCEKAWHPDDIFLWREFTLNERRN